MKISMLLSTVVLFSSILCTPISGQLAQTGNKGILRTHSANTLGKGVLGINTAAYIGLDNKYIIDGLVLVDADSTAYHPEGLAPTYVSTYYSAAFGVFDFMDFNLTLPFYVDNSNIGDNGVDNGIGDLAFAIKVRYPPYNHSPIFNMTYFGEFTFPTATKGKGLFPRQPYYTRARNVSTKGNSYLPNPVDSLNFPHSNSRELYMIFDSLVKDSLVPSEEYYYGAKSVSFLAKMLWTLDIAQIKSSVPLKWNLNFGALFAGSAGTDNIFVLASSIEWTPAPIITVFTDFSGQARFRQLSASFDLGKEPLLLGSGVALNIPGGAHFTLAFDKCFSRNDRYKTVYYNPEKRQAYQTKIFPDIGISIGLSWNGGITKSAIQKATN